MTTIQPLPSLRTCRFGQRKEIHHQRLHSTSKANQVVRPPTISSEEIDSNVSVLITDVRHRDWNFADDLENMNRTARSTLKFRVIPSMSNTLKMQVSTNQDKPPLYDEYDMDEQDFQWLMKYNGYRIEKGLPELDENVFEYVMQSLEQQCFTVYRRKSYEDTIQCDACRRLDDVDDLIQCIQCNTIVHKKCYGIDNDNDDVGHETWKCLCCRQHNSLTRCYLCHQTQGALKPMKIVTDGEEEVWVHLSCAFWCPSITFKAHNDPVLSTKLSNDGSCAICYQTLGVKIVCSWKHCSCRFHARCAMNHGQDMLMAESDDKNSVRLLALCSRHTEKIDPSESNSRKKRAVEQQQHRFEQYASDVDLALIGNETKLLPDILESIHTYWLLKRKANGGRPLIDVPASSFENVHDQRINLPEFAHQHRLAQLGTSTSTSDQLIATNMLQFLVAYSESDAVSPTNFFVKFARRQRSALTGYDRNLFCVLDDDKKVRRGLTHISSVVHDDF